MVVRGVATYLNVDAKTIFRLVKRGAIPGFQAAGASRFKKEDIDAWIELRKAATASGVHGDDAPSAGGRDHFERTG